MTKTPDFSTFFQRATGLDVEPYAYQRRLAEEDVLRDVTYHWRCIPDD